MRHGANTKVRGRFSEMRRGPSHLCARNASEALETFVRHPEKTFSTVSARNGHADCIARCPLSGAKRKTYARSECESAPNFAPFRRRMLTLPFRPIIVSAECLSNQAPGSLLEADWGVKRHADSHFTSATRIRFSVHTGSVCGHGTMREFRREVRSRFWPLRRIEHRLALLH
jgi:hypothetical protein